MAALTSLDNVAVLKIHPAIGVARLANNDDHYEFFDYEEKRKQGKSEELKYMSKQDGRHVVMRQAVQYKIFAYGSGGEEIGELSPEAMKRLGVKATWTAHVANRKLNHYSGGSKKVIDAEASASGEEHVRLEGNSSFPNSDEKVWLGEINGTGLFLPPKGGVYREDKNKVIPGYGSHRQDNGVQDTTSDGSIKVTLEGPGNLPDVIPACVVVAPQQHSPDVSPGEVGGNNRDFVKSTKSLLGIHGSLPDSEGYQMDLAMMNTINADYHPGMELSLLESRALPEPREAFYPRGQQGINANEIRPSYQAGQPGHADHGALTAGLCSAWQTDLTACLNWWTAEFPQYLYHGDDLETAYFLSRKEYEKTGPQMGDPEDLNAYVDRMGIGRNTNGDIDFLAETERGKDDNVPAATPQPPFPLEPQQ